MATLTPEATSFTLDNMGRFLCNTLTEAGESAAQTVAGRPRKFDVIVGGGGTFGALIAQIVGCAATAKDSVSVDYPDYEMSGSKRGYFPMIDSRKASLRWPRLSKCGAMRVPAALKSGSTSSLAMGSRLPLRMRAST